MNYFDELNRLDSAARSDATERAEWAERFGRPYPAYDELPPLLLQAIGGDHVLAFSPLDETVAMQIIEAWLLCQLCTQVGGAS